MSERVYVEDPTTLRRAVKEDVADRIELEIGDSKQVEAYPQAKITRWDNEVNLSVRRDNGARSFSRVGDQVRFESATEDVVIYELDGFEDGGLEIELHLKEKPKSNVFDFSIETKGLNFFYQDEITDEEAEQNRRGEKDTRTLEQIKRDIRPENVVGSYAVYHATKKHNVVGGKAYKTGKFAHIYRPHVVDADGNETWADLNIDVESKKLVVTVPQVFLAKATYPVIVDPTVGYTSTGTSNYTLVAGTASDIQADIAPAGTLYSVSGIGGDLLNFNVYITSSSFNPNGNLYGVIYETTGYTIEQQSTATTTIPDGGWATASFSAALPLPNDNYAFVVWIDNVNPFMNVVVGYDSTTETSVYQTTATTVAELTSWPPADPWSAAKTSVTRRYAIYAEFEAQLPSVTTAAVTDITTTTATFNGEITDVGGSSVTKRGFVYDTSSRSKPDGSSSLLTTDTFETGFGNWVNVSGDNYDWTRDSGGTPSSNTGPSTGNGGSTWYVFTETSQGTTGSTFFLEYDIGSTKSGYVDFYYHMYGTYMGTLRLEGWDGSTWTEIWSDSGNKGNLWFNATTPATDFVGYSKLRFVGVRGTSWSSDMALDDISVYEVSSLNPSESVYANYVEDTGTYSAGTYSIGATSLTPSTTYYVRAYAYNSDGYSYADTEVSFSTVAAGVSVGVKLSGTFADKPLKVKSGGSFADAVAIGVKPF